jgi:hypothetical protein
MDAIIVRCKKCTHAMKFSAEKAGKKAKCPKCEAIVVVQADEEAQEKEAAPTEAAAAPVEKVVDPDDDPTGGYGVFTDPELEQIMKQRAAEEEARTKKKKDKKKLPKMLRKMKVIADAESWAKVRLGMMFTFVGVCIWIVAHLAQGSYVVIGKVEFPEFALQVAGNLEVRAGENDLPNQGQFWELDDINLYLGMIAGRDFVGFARAMLTLACLLYLLQAIAWFGGYVISLSVPRRFGTFGQLIAGMVLGFVNFLTMFALKILPVLGVISYVMVPLITPEIALTEYNMERQMPLHVLWSGAPFWENFVNLLVKFVFYLQPTFGCIFLWSVGTAMRDDHIEKSAKGLTQMSLGTFFILFSFHMLSLCGASPVLVIVLRVFYIVWYCFLFLFMLQYASLLLKCRAVLFDKINPKNELQD